MSRMTKERRRAAVRRKAIRQAAIKAKAEFATKFRNLQGWFDEFDGVYLTLVPKRGKHRVLGV